MKMKVIGAAAVAFCLCGAVDAFAGDGNKGGDDKFAKMDTNADGKITSSEHAAGGRTMFQSMDTNKDGSVTAAEMDAAHAAHAGKTEGMKRSSADKIKKMDTNGDGKLSASEHETGSRDMFAKSDANKDGSVTADEMKAAHQKHMADKK
jgi:Ca2+-binding EF-hand superfamily protein